MFSQGKGSASRAIAQLSAAKIRTLAIPSIAIISAGGVSLDGVGPQAPSSRELTARPRHSRWMLLLVHLNPKRTKFDSVSLNGT
jgi:hypothetical protein